VLDCVREHYAQRFLDTFGSPFSQNTLATALAAFPYASEEVRVALNSIYRSDQG
jgi:hypothetical protein|tara:strand:+ start:369 stop:530 length:162 start_codon:yes stop_codon:yes gene_type:complete